MIDEDDSKYPPLKTQIFVCFGELFLKINFKLLFIRQLCKEDNTHQPKYPKSPTYPPINQPTGPSTIELPSTGLKGHLLTGVPMIGIPVVSSNKVELTTPENLMAPAKLRY